MRKDSLEPEDFEEDAQLHTKCGIHVQLIYYVASVVCVVIDLIGIILLLVLFMYPEFHRKSPLYIQLVQYYDRNYAYSYHIMYNTVIIFWILLFFMHILSIGMGLFGVKLKKPYLLIPQIILLLVRLGLLTFICCGCLTMNFVGSDLIIATTLIAFLYVLVAGYYLTCAVFAYRYSREKYVMIQKILASTKSVHFKKGRKRNK